MRIVTLRDQIKSSEIREYINFQDVVRFAKSRRKYCRDDIDKMGDDPYTKWARYHKPTSRSVHGRPQESEVRKLDLHITSATI